MAVLPPNNIMTDQALYIREIQNRLRELSFKDDRIPEISVDGIYGPQTTTAVRAFQEITGLEPTGQVDRRTWDALYDAYQKATGTERPLAGIVTFPSPDYVIRRGDSGDIVYAVQFMLNGVSKAFHNLEPVELTGVYDEPTAKAVTVIQQMANLPQTGEVDKSTCDMLLGAYMTHRNPS